MPKRTTGKIYLITGVMASGKSSVAQALAERFETSVHLRGDSFRRAIVRGRVDMGSQSEDEAYRQLRLRYQLSVQAALGYAEAGFTVVYQDVILGPLLEDVVSAFGEADLQVVVLCPNPATVKERELGRAKVGYGAVTIEQLQRGLAETPKIGLWIDSSALSIDETLAQILHPSSVQGPA